MFTPGPCDPFQNCFSPDSRTGVVSPLQSRVADHDAALEPPALLLRPEHADEEEPEPSVHNPLEVAVEQILIVGQLEGLELGIGLVIAAGSVRGLVEHLAGDEAGLEGGHPLVEAVLVPPVLLDGAQGPDVGAGQAEHALLKCSILLL